MNLLFVGDVHAADKPPSGRVDDYRSTVMQKLSEVGLLAATQNSEAVFFTGDIFHSKQGNRVSDRLRQLLIVLFKLYPCPVYVVPGNHDMGMSGLSSLKNQPLGTLEEAGAIKILTKAQRMGKGDTAFWIIPRPYDTDAEGFHTGETDPSYYSLTEEETKDILGEGYVRVIGLAHGSLLPPGDTRQYPYVDVSTIPNIEDYDLYVSGHIHEPLGKHLIGHHTIFANPGSLLRTARDTANYLRNVQVLSVDIEPQELIINEVPISQEPALEVFGRKDSEDKVDMGNADISSFVDLLGKGLRADSLSIPDLLAETGETIEPKVKAKVQEHLEAAS